MSIPSLDDSLTALQNRDEMAEGLTLMSLAFTVPDHPRWADASEALASRLSRARGISVEEASRVLRDALPVARVAVYPPAMWQMLLDGEPMPDVDHDPGPVIGSDGQLLPET